MSYEDVKRKQHSNPHVRQGNPLAAMRDRHKLMGYCHNCEAGYPRRCPRCGSRVHGEGFVDEAGSAAIIAQCQECGSRWVKDKHGEAW